jgi:hypothetical protein
MLLIAGGTEVVGSSLLSSAECELICAENKVRSYPRSQILELQAYGWKRKEAAASPNELK